LPTDQPTALWHQFNTVRENDPFMKYFHAIILTALMILATPAFAQRDANTSSARAAYSIKTPYSEPRVKKNKQKAEKEKPRKARKNKTKNVDLARERRRSLHF
jgi:hypothetical protein